MHPSRLCGTDKVAQLNETQARHHLPNLLAMELAQGGHLKNDVPRLLDTLRERFPGVTLELWPALGDADPVLDAISAWIVNTAPH